MKLAHGFLLPALMVLSQPGLTVAAESPSFVPKNRADAVAWEFFQAHPAPDSAAWSRFLQDRKLTPGSNFANEVSKRVAGMQQTLADGIQPGSPDFMPYYQELGGGIAAKATPPAPPMRTKDEQDAYDKLQVDLGYNQGMADRYEEIGRDADAKAASEGADKTALKTLADVARKKAKPYSDKAALDKIRIEEMDTALAQKAASRSPEEIVASQIQASRLAGKERALGESLDVAAPKSPLLEAGAKTGKTPLNIMLGTRMVTPYSIKTDEANKGMIDSTSTTLRPYLEIGWTSFWAADASRKAAYPGRSLVPGEEFKSGYDLLTFWRGWDVDGKVSFLFNQNDKLDATTIAGSGDINGELGVDKLLYAYAFNENAWSIGLGGRVGGNANRLERKVHADYFTGVHFNFSTITESDEQSRMSLIRFGLGVAWIDSLTYDPASGKTKVIFDGDRPAYRQIAVPVFETELWYPVSSFGVVKLGSRLYGKADPSPWTVQLSYSIDAEKLFKGLVGFQDTSLPSPKAKTPEATPGP